MAKLKPGSVTIDLVTGGIYGDIDHCPVKDLLESAEALLSLLPKVHSKDLFEFSKDFDTGCYVRYFGKGVDFDVKDCQLKADIHRGPGGIDGSWDRPFRLTKCVNCGKEGRERKWKFDWHSRLIGSVKDGQVSSNIEGIPDVNAERRAEHERWLAEIERKKPPVQTSLNLEF